MNEAETLESKQRTKRHDYIYNKDNLNAICLSKGIRNY